MRTFTLPVATVRSFDDLPVPCRAVAADLATFDAVVLGSDDLVRVLGADVVIAVNIGTPLAAIAEIGSPMAVTGQRITAMMERETRQRRASPGESDLLIGPDLGAFGVADFTRCGEIIALREAAARAATEGLARYALEPAAWAEHVARLPRPDRAPLRLSAIRVERDSALSTAYLERRISSQAGRPLDSNRLDDDLRRLYGLVVFERVG